MEEIQNQNNQGTQESSNGVSFPSVPEQKKSGGAKTVLIVGILVLVAILGFVIYKSAGKKSSEEVPAPTSFDNLTTPSSDTTVQTFTPAPTATAAATVKVEKNKVQIQVQNGTGITGDAAYLQTQLSNIGYTNIKVGNSDSTVTATNVTFSSTLDNGVVTEITQKLNSLYQTVTTKTSTTSTFDVVVITGLRKGATAKPEASGSATPKATVTPTPKASSSPSTSPTKSPSPTP